MTPRELVEDVRQLFSLPTVALRLNELVGNPDTGNKEIIEVLQLDMGLAATVLRLANSAWYGLPNKVDTLSGPSPSSATAPCATWCSRLHSSSASRASRRNSSA
jgi:hypothetical protein